MNQRLLSIAALTIAAAGAVALPATASEYTGARGGVSFVCGMDEAGLPTTIARTATADYPVIVWQSEHFSQSGWTPQKRCEHVSAKLQDLQSRDQLRFLAAGYMNSYPVICTASSLTSQACDEQVFTLQYNPNSGESLADHARQRLQSLKPLGSGAVARPLLQAGGETPSSGIVEYYDIGSFLNTMSSPAGTSAW